MDYSKLFVVKHNSKVFEPETIVSGEIYSWSGDLYKVEDLNDSSKSELLMYYDLYPFTFKNYKFNYYAQWQEIVNNFITKNRKD